MDYYKLLGVNRGCSREDLHRAFRELSKRYHPDRFPEAERGKAEKQYQQIVIAFNTLKDERLKEKYDRNWNRPGSSAGPADKEEDPVIMGQKYYKAGLQRYHLQQFDLGLELLKKAVHYRETAEAYYYKGMCELELPRLKKDAVHSLQKAVSLNEHHVNYHVQLGKTLIQLGMQSRAKAVVQKAMRMFPNEGSLIALDQELDPEKYRKGKLGGLMGNLFGNKK